MTGLIDRAEQRGLVQRTASPVDGRSVQVVITPSGQKLIDAAAAAFATEIAVLVAELTATQRGRLSDAASRIVATDARPGAASTSSTRPPIRDSAPGLVRTPAAPGATQAGHLLLGRRGFGRADRQPAWDWSSWARRMIELLQGGIISARAPRHSEQGCPPESLECLPSQLPRVDLSQGRAKVLAAGIKQRRWRGS